MSKFEKPLIHKEYKLKKFDRKGGWTYAEIPEIPQDKANSFGWVRVKGKIDSFEIEKYHLMPMGKGKLFLPIKAEIRKKIKKQAGDFVTVILYPDNSPLEIPQDFEECLKTEPIAHTTFHELKEIEQKKFIDWVYASKKPETKAERIVKTLEKLLKGERLRNKFE